MTLFLMPVLYYGFNRIREKRDIKKELRITEKLARIESKRSGIL